MLVNGISINDTATICLIHAPQLISLVWTRYFTSAQATIAECAGKCLQVGANIFLAPTYANTTATAATTISTTTSSNSVPSTLSCYCDLTGIDRLVEQIPYFLYNTYCNLNCNSGGGMCGGKPGHYADGTTYSSAVIISGIPSIIATNTTSTLFSSNTYTTSLTATSTAIAVSIGATLSSYSTSTPSAQSFISTTAIALITSALVITLVLAIVIVYMCIKTRAQQTKDIAKFAWDNLHRSRKDSSKASIPSPYFNIFAPPLSGTSSLSQKSLTSNSTSNSNNKTVQPQTRQNTAAAAALPLPPIPPSRRDGNGNILREFSFKTPQYQQQQQPVNLVRDSSGRRLSVGTPIPISTAISPAMLKRRDSDSSVVALTPAVKLMTKGKDSNNSALNSSYTKTVKTATVATPGFGTGRAFSPLPHPSQQQQYQRHDHQHTYKLQVQTANHSQRHYEHEQHQYQQQQQLNFLHQEIERHQYSINAQFSNLSQKQQADVWAETAAMNGMKPVEYYEWYNQITKNIKNSNRDNISDKHGSIYTIGATESSVYGGGGSHDFDVAEQKRNSKRLSLIYSAGGTGDDYGENNLYRADDAGGATAAAAATNGVIMAALSSAARSSRGLPRLTMLDLSPVEEISEPSEGSVTTAGVIAALADTDNDGIGWWRDANKFEETQAAKTTTTGQVVAAESTAIDGAFDFDYIIDSPVSTPAEMTATLKEMGLDFEASLASSFGRGGNAADADRNSVYSMTILPIARKGLAAIFFGRTLASSSSSSSPPSPSASLQSDAKKQKAAALKTAKALALLTLAARAKKAKNAAAEAEAALTVSTTAPSPPPPSIVPPSTLSISSTTTTTTATTTIDGIATTVKKTTVTTGTLTLPTIYTTSTTAATTAFASVIGQFAASDLSDSPQTSTTPIESSSLLSLAIGDTIETMPKTTKDKIYAVRTGRNPGIYQTWDECSTQVFGHRNAEYKSFSTTIEAADYLRAPSRFVGVPTHNEASVQSMIRAAAVSQQTKKNKDGAVVAVAAGKRRLDLSEFSKATTSNADTTTTTTKNARMPALKKQKLSAVVGGAGAPLLPLLRPNLDDINESSLIDNSASSGVGAIVLREKIDVYTDGACGGNGKAGARGGIGVFFGNGDARNISQSLPGPAQTNNRAELLAAIMALRAAPANVFVNLYTDSCYVLDGITKWIQGWKKRNWRSASGSQVLNQDLWKDLDVEYIRRGSSRGVNFIYVKAHNGQFGNEQADRLAVLGAMTI
ncbi:Ribonuclease H1 [Physocladia obscura]|uniref:Ribonuclease H n=1 Tax=Physocladia obscura TaxID=109957 RepID=A0AAD5XL54_9FUNG|nr:Ribonuclease H1 [Physocladia obscura]